MEINELNEVEPVSLDKEYAGRRRIDEFATLERVIEAINKVMIYLKWDRRVRNWFRTAIVFCILLISFNVFLSIIMFNYMQSTALSMSAIEKRVSAIEYSVTTNEANRNSNGDRKVD